MASRRPAGAAELAVEDFKFDGPLGSQGTTIEKVGTNHFKVTLGHAPRQKGWNNKLQFQITRNAKGNALRLDVVFLGGNAYTLNEYFHSWSHDARTWHPIQWKHKSRDSAKGDALEFPEFAEDIVYVGHQVPMSYEDTVAMIEEWRKSPFVKAHVIGQSLGKRDIHRVEITDPKSPHPEAARWVHYFGNQHPGEHNAQWRMVGMIEWLLSEAGADCRQRSICHFVLMTSPDAPSKGWYRVNAQGVDMNRSYRAEGADPEKQAHEACVVQKDLEKLMASAAPVSDLWSMHTWGGIVEPVLLAGPEMGARLGPWTGLRDAVERHDPKNLVKPLKLDTKPSPTTYWTEGPHKQFGITTVLCEGGGAIYTRDRNKESGVVLIQGIAEYYKGTRK
ncbi:MAG TPA: M14 family zinc carboxypeptidase [Planctomycetota bacterium]|nr:M14 family zinc carboxypeptidase [Planctomycetota bacterium]